MKKSVFFICFLFCIVSIKAQETFTVNGETLQLKTEIDGKLDLLWTITNGNYRYFIRTSDAVITELTNTKNAQGKYQETYKTTLKNATSDANVSTDNVNLTLASLSRFIDNYNASVDSNYSATEGKIKAEFRLGLFAGITNSPFISNPKNIKTPVAGIELEVLDGKNKQHSVFLQLRHTFDNDDFEYATTELSLGYRFRVVNTWHFSFYGDVKFATVNFTKTTVRYIDDSSNLVTDHISDTAFDVPFIFGIGADYKISKCSYITLGYNQLFAAFLNTHDNFSTDFTLGYKFKL